ncbi:hypothetical protein FI667_g9641, partial [Globisporangium splendens]
MKTRSHLHRSSKQQDAVRRGVEQRGGVRRGRDARDGRHLQGARGRAQQARDRRHGAALPRHAYALRRLRRDGGGVDGRREPSAERAGRPDLHESGRHRPHELGQRRQPGARASVAPCANGLKRNI